VWAHWYADSWSSWGGYGLTSEAELFRLTRDRSLRLTDLCVERGRDPVALRRSLVCFPPTRPWASTEAFTDMVGRYRSIGINEFVLYWPRTWDSRASQEDTVFEHVMSDVAPGLKAVPR
jgi:hypothetical protein